jgi:hypothetical protein
MSFLLCRKGGLGDVPGIEDILFNSISDWHSCCNLIFNTGGTKICLESL